MKKILLIICILFLYCDKIYASRDSAISYIVMDMDSGYIYESKNKDKKMLIASTSKILTAIIAIEKGILEDTVVVDESIKKSYGSGIYISVGEEIKLKDLLYGLMLRSGNDAAIMISTYIAGSEEEFVKLMNKKAKEIGMTNTIFYNSSGLDNNSLGNISTAYDMALLTKYAMNNKIYREIVKTKKYTCKSNMKSYIWYNKNKLLNYDYITGGKTGYTEKAKRTLVSTGSKDNINIVIVTLKDSDDWNTHKELYNKIFNNYKSIKIVDKDSFNIKNKYYKKIYINNDIYINIEKYSNKDIIVYIKLNKIDNYKDNDLVGEINIYIDNYLIKKDNVYVDKVNKKNIFNKIRKWLYD